MRTLVAMACLCVIGMTVWFVLSQMAEARHIRAIAIKQLCEENVSGGIDGLSYHELKEKHAVAERCLRYFKTGEW